MSAVNSDRHPERSLTKLTLVAFLGLTLLWSGSAVAAFATFTGPGNFSDATKWNGHTLPSAGDNLRINGTCTFDNAALNLAYGTLNVGFTVAGTLNWPVGGTNTLIVTSVSSGIAGSAIDMTNGGTLQIGTSWTTTNQTFTPGSGTINWNVTGAASTLPATITVYNNLTITALTQTASLGAGTTVNGNLLISSGTLDVTASNLALNVSGNFTNNAIFNSNTGTVTMNGTAAQAIGGTSTTTFSSLTIANTSAAVSANTNFNVSGTMTVNANAVLTPAATVVINSVGAAGTVTGSGTAQVTATALTGYSNQYKFTTNTLTNLTVEYNGAAAQTVSAVNYGNLKINNANGATLGGNTTVNGTLTLTSGTLSVAANTLTLNGPTIAGTPSNLSTTSSSSLSFGGTSTGVNLPSSVTQLNSLSINNSNGITLNSSPTINSTLTFTSGNLLAGLNTVIIPVTGTVSRTSGYVIGNLQKSVVTGVVSQTFEIGDSNAYAPVTISFGNVSAAGNLTAKTVSGEHPDIANSGIDSTQDVNRYWILSNSGISFTNYSATFTYASGSPVDLDSGVTPANFIIGKADSCNGSLQNCTWIYPTLSGTPTSTSAQASGMTGFSGFAIGQQKLNNFLITVPASPVSTCSPQAITITARRANNTTLTNYTGLISITTSATHGDWSINSANGTLTNGTPDSGAATYQFVAADNGSITLNLTDTHADDLTITVSDSSAGVSSTSSILQFRGNAFVITNDTIQVAGRNQAMSVKMIVGSSCGTTNTNYTGARTLKAWLTLDASDPGGAVPTIGALSLPSSTPASNNLTLTFTSGVANFNLSTTDVGKYILNLRDDNKNFASGANIDGSSSTITTRPFALAISAISQGATNNPGGTASTGSKFITAADSFQATVGAYLYNSAADTKNLGVPDATATLAQVTANGATPSYKWPTTLAAAPPFTPAGGTLGTLSNGALVAANFTSGIATPSNLSYNEVGSFSLTGVASNFLNSGITLNAIIFNSSGSQSSGVVGRFFPDHFTLLSGSSIIPACGGATGFTYMGQPNLGYSFTIEARNKSDVKTSNYDNNTLGYSTGSVTLLAANNNNGTDLSSRLPIPTANWTTGTYAFSTSTTTFSRPASTPDGSFDSLQIGIQVNDTDGPVLAGRNMNPAIAGACGGSCTGVAIGGTTTKVRFGRLRLSNALGSEVLDLPVPLRAQYWSGTAFATNTLDSCTTISASNIVLSNYQGNLNSGNLGSSHISISGAFNTGASNLKLTKPSSAVNGSVDLCVDLDVGAGGDTTCQATTPAGIPYLQGAWSSTTYNRDPSARASFGFNKNAIQFIYQRENY